MFRNTCWQQWDLQEARRLRHVNQTAAWVQLNNLYLSIERGEVKMSIHMGNQLHMLVTHAYDRGDPMISWWMDEFSSLPGWLDY